MPRHETILVGDNNTKVKITGQNELLVKDSSSNTSKTPNFIRSSTTGVIAPAVYSCSFYNAGNANATVLGTDLLPNEAISFDAGGLNNKFVADSIDYDGTDTDLVIIFVS